MKEYKLSKTWVILTWIVAPVLILAAVWTAIAYDKGQKRIKVSKYYSANLLQAKKVAGALNFGGANTYYIEVPIHSNDPESLNVPREFYTQVETGDEVQHDLRPGLFGIPWVKVRTSDGRLSAAGSHRAVNQQNP